MIDFQTNKLSKIESTGNSFKRFEDELTDPPNQGFTFFHAFFLGLQGKFQRSFEILNECIDVWKEYGQLQALEAIYYKIAELNFEIHWSGGAANWQEVEEVLNELIVLAEKGIGSKASGLCMLSMTKTFQGNHQKAHHYLESAKQVIVDYSSFQGSIDISISTAHLAAAEGHWQESFAVYEDLVETFSQKGYRWAHAHTLCDWGDVLASRGESSDFESAEVLYNQAKDIYKDLEATWYQEQVEKRLAQIT